MIKVNKIVKDETGQPEVGINIPPQYFGIILQAGLNALIGMGMVEFVTMTQEQFAIKSDKPADGISEEESEMWADFLKNAPPKDLPQA